VSDRGSPTGENGAVTARRPTILRHATTVVAALGALLVGVGVGGGTAAPAGAATNRTTGPPVVVHFVNLDASSSTLPARSGARAATAQVNATGGIGGRPLKLVECLTDGTVEQGKVCVDQAVAAKPAAVLAVQPGGVSDNLAALTFTGIPYVGQTCNTNTTLSGQYTSFCFGSDFVGLFSTSAGYLKTLATVKKVAVPYPNVPAASSGVKAFAAPIFQRAGMSVIEVPIPDGATDLAAAVGPAFAANPDAVVGLLNGPACSATMKARGTRTLPVVLPALCSDPDVLADAGAAATGALFVRQTITLDRANADVRTYTKAMKRFAPRTDPGDVYAQAGFAAVMNLTNAQRSVPTGTAVDGASTTAALRATKTVPLFLGGGSTYTCDGTASPGLKALCSLQAHVVAYDGKGRWTDKGQF